MITGNAFLIINKEPDLEQTIIKFKNCVRDLRKLHDDISDSALISIFLTMLPNNVENIVKQLAALESTKKATNEDMPCVFSSIRNRWYVHSSSVIHRF